MTAAAGASIRDTGSGADPQPAPHFATIHCAIFITTSRSRPLKPRYAMASQGSPTLLPPSKRNRGASWAFLFVPLTLGLTWLLVIMESVYVMTGKQVYKDMTKFWSKLFGINVLGLIATRSASREIPGISEILAKNRQRVVSGVDAVTRAGSPAQESRRRRRAPKIRSA